MKEQTITIEHENTSAVFTDDGRVFYDLESLVVVLDEMVANRLRDMETCDHNEGCNPDLTAAYLMGQADITVWMNRERQNLLLEHALNLTPSE